MPSYDIVMVSDFRFPGGTSASLAEEIHAQAAAGYTTALVQVDGPLVANAAGFNRRIRHCVETQMADLIEPEQPVTGRLAVFRHPAVFGDLPSRAPQIIVERAVVVANQAATDTASAMPYYDPAIVDANVRRLVGPEVTWTAIGPSVRASLEPLPPGLRLADGEWHNIIDVDQWAVDRSIYVGSKPVIGRHSRPQFTKWPDSKDALLAAYPEDDEFVVRILGGAKVAEDVLGRPVDGWQVEPFDARPAAEFLRDLDFFVYFHHPGWVEAFGRTILEALASGAVAVLPPQFAELFEDAAVYGEPSDVRRIVRELYADKSAYDAQSRRGGDFVRQRFGPASHVARIEASIGGPTTPVTPVADEPATAPQVRGGAVQAPRVLFVSSNGAGMGHLTRLMAMARRASAAIQPVFLSLSQAVPIVATTGTAGPGRQDGFGYEYCPSRAALDMDTRSWNVMFEARFIEIMERHRPAAVVFDGTWPYLGLVAARPRFPEIRFVWSRRGMWKAGASPEQLDKAAVFDLVIEPGEFAAPFDRGVTRRAEAFRVDPIVFLDRSELLDRAEARRELGLDPDRPAVLVTLGAGNINDLTSDLGGVIDALARDPDKQICVTKPPISGREQPGVAQVTHLSVYPLSRYALAFEYAFAAAGYNSYHEHIAFGLPSIFVPNDETRTDDQVGRARYAAEAGVGLHLPQITPPALADAVARMDDAGARAQMRAACAERWPGNGAQAAVDRVENLVLRAREEVVA